MRKIVVRPEYRHLTPLVERIPQNAFPVEEVFRGSRNLCYRMTLGGIPVTVKKFKVPTWANRIAYTFFRSGKARRSYEYAGRLLAMGIDTPHPVAFIEVSRGALYHTGYYISLFTEDLPLSEAVCLGPAERELLYHCFGRFTARLHSMGVVHHDYNCGNIYFARDGEGYRFSLIDINRMKFRKPFHRTCLMEFDRLGLDLFSTVKIVTAYAAERGMNPELCCAAVLWEKGWGWNRRKKKLKYRLLGLFMKKYREKYRSIR